MHPSKYTPYQQRFSGLREGVSHFMWGGQTFNKYSPDVMLNNYVYGFDVVIDTMTPS